jgi:hypothetical protein
VVVAVAVLVAAVALTSRQQSPPTIAEFAPQAVAQIKQTLDEQGIDETRTPDDPEQVASPPPPSAGPTVGPDGLPLAQPSPSPRKEIQVNRTRSCIGTPPRQTEDPQSPPCTPYFDPDLDNGGATSKGSRPTRSRSPCRSSSWRT